MVHLRFVGAGDNQTSELDDTNKMMMCQQQSAGWRLIVSFTGFH